MAESCSRAQAESQVLRGENESLDSQQIYEIYAKQFGVGVTSSSPRSGRDLQVSRRDRSTSPVAAPASSTPATSPIANSTIAETVAAGDLEDISPDAVFSNSQRFERGNQSIKASNSLPDDTIADSQPTHLYLPAEPDHPTTEAGDSLTYKGTEAHATWSDRRTAQSFPSLHDPRPTRKQAAPPKRRKMDNSQASPTQQNDDRDYQSHYDSFARSGDSPIPESPHPGLEDGEAADEDRTHDGLVRFGSLDFLGGPSDSQKSDIEPSSPILEGPGLANTRHGWKFRTSSSQQHSSLQRPEDGTPFKPSALAPETPAQNRNPFAGNALLGGQAMAASQLFGNTQQLSSAVKGGFSPTSSRPSPNFPLNYHSISTNAIDSPLKNPYNITSPTVATSSPAIQPSRPRTSSSMAEHQTPAPARWQEDLPDADTPGDATVRPQRRFRDPMSTYVSMKESQERRSNTEVPQVKDSFYDSDDAMAKETRRRHVARKKEEAMRSLAEVSFHRPGTRDNVEVPSTTQKNRRKHLPALSPIQNLERTAVAPAPESNGPDEDDMSTVADSQEPLPPPVGIAATEGTTTHSSEKAAEPAVGIQTGPEYDSSNERIPDSTGCTAAEQEAAHAVIADDLPSEDRIPDTSPVCLTRSAAPLDQTPDATEKSKSSEAPPVSPPVVDEEAELPQPSRRSGRVPRPSARARMILSDDTSSATRKPTASNESRTTLDAPLERADADDLKVRSDMSVIPESSPRPVTQLLPSSPPATVPPQLEHVLQSREEPPSTPPVPLVTASSSASSSSLTPFSSTPELPEDMTPGTMTSGSTSRRRQSAKRGLAQLKTALDDLKQSPRRATRRGSRQSARLGSTSTDELTKSPSTIGFENSIVRPNKTGVKAAPPNAPHRFQQATTGSGLFSDMAFAISFQAKRPGESADAYGKRMASSSDIERQILEAGGRLLSQGFEELFDPTTLKTMAASPEGSDTGGEGLHLAPGSCSLGFTALIADGHSRKPKYMQALALGLPCISDRWISTCVRKRAVVDWSPYLLCAGQSAYLRGAIRSRVLTPYVASDARLEDVIERRTKLLEGGKILLVLKKSRQEDKKLMYVFLTHVLGASLVRAHTVAEAQEMIRQRELQHEPFDWVYVDENTGTDDDLFGDAPGSTATTGKKRKRASAATNAPARNNIRTLNDELVIQSLILGRMIEEGDLEG